MEDNNGKRIGTVSRSAFLKAMRSVASSVTVVTTAGAQGRHGATVSAFCSVSADPPMVLVCLKANSRIALQVADNRAFCVNVLASSCPEIAERFAAADDAKLQDRFEGLGFAADGGSLPVIPEATAFECLVTKHVDAGTHRVFFGEPVALWEGAAEPLTYLNGAYHRVVPHSRTSCS